jgi:putative ABC transport system permease protein
MISVSIAVFAAVFADGFVSGFMDSMTRNVTKNQTGHVNIETAEYRARERFMPARSAIPDSDAAIAALRADPALASMIEVAAPRARFGVVLSSEAGNKTALGIGADPEAERRLLMLDRTILPGGSYLRSPGEAIVGEKLAADLGLGVGSALKVVTEKADYGLGFKRFRIAGLYRTGLESFDRASFMVSMDDARELLGLGKGASQILLMLKDYRRSERAAPMVEAALRAAGLAVAADPKISGPGADPKALTVRPWTRIGDMAALLGALSGIYSCIELVFIFLGAFIIANIMMMVVLERRREIGILKSMGMRRPRILALFLAEGSMLGAFGSAAGVVAGMALNAYFRAVGMDVSKLIGGTDLQMDNVVRPGVHPLAGLGFFALGVLVSALVAFLPSRSAAGMDPIEAIRSV